MTQLELALPDFDRDLRYGVAREDALVHTLLGSRVEVKSDRICRRTGNLFVEYRCNGRASGIAATRAQRWAFEYDADRWLVVPTALVEQLSRRALADDRRAVGGDRGRSEGALVPIKWLFERPSEDR